MMKLLPVVTSLCLLPAITMAQEATVEYVSLKKGDPAPEKGFFFSDSNMAALAAKTDYRLKSAMLDKDTELKKVKLELETEISRKQIEIDYSKQLNDGLLKIKDAKIEEMAREQKYNKIYFIAGTACGITTSVLIFYVAVKAVQ